MIKTLAGQSSIKLKGRGSHSTIDGRYLQHNRERIDDGWQQVPEQQRIATSVTIEKPRTIITRNQSPDIPFDRSINPYRGCEHGCSYCYARPTHAYQDLSPGIDFESKLFAKPNAAELLKKELAKPAYVCQPIALGTNTDPYQPVERQWKITRAVIEVLHECRHPLTIVTKSWLVERDSDLLATMAQQNLVQVFLSVTTLDNQLAGNMEPRASAPRRRLETIKQLNDAGIPTGVMFAPVIPFINDAEMEAVLEQAKQAGAEAAGYVMLRLPYEIKQLFREWMELHVPLKAKHVMNVLRDIRNGKENDTNFHSRMSGSGEYAGLIKQRFNNACRRLGINDERSMKLNVSDFRPPLPESGQQSLF